MAGLGQIEVQKAQAMQEAAQTVRELLGQESPRLYAAAQDVVGRQDPDFVFAMVLSELCRVVVAQQRRIEELEGGK